MLSLAYIQPLTPAGGVAGSTLIALVPVAVLLIFLAGIRLSAWLAVILGSAVTFALAWGVWGMPVVLGAKAYALGGLTGLWAVDWIVLWGVVIYNTLVVTGSFGAFKRWLLRQATADVRIQTLLMAWAFGALLEGLVGFGYPWAVVAPILTAIGVRAIDAIRVAAIANNAPVSFGALGAPIIGLSAVTNLPLNDLTHTIGRIVAVLALLPPFILIFLVSGKRGLRDGWPLAIVASLGYIAGQFPVTQLTGPYLPDITGSITAFAAILGFSKIWRPKVMLGFGGVELSAEQAADIERRALEETPAEVAALHPALAAEATGGARSATVIPAGRAGAEASVWRGIVPFLILVAVVVAWTGPWSTLTSHLAWHPEVKAVSSISHKAAKADFKFAPLVAGTSILASWLLICAYLRPRPGQLAEVFANTFRQIWGALVVGFFIFGLAFVFNLSGMANSMANGFSKIGTAFIVVAPLLGWIAVALSGSNTSSNAIFGQFQYTVAKLLHFPVLLLPSLNSVGAEVGKPVAPQTASVGVSTTGYVRKEGDVIRHNMAWTLVLLAYLVIIGVVYYLVAPGAV